MFASKTTAPADLDKLIDTTTNSMLTMDAGTEEYATALTQLETLHKIKAINSNDRVSADTKVTVAANLIGIAAILNFERLGIVTSKALGFVTKLR